MTSRSIPSAFVILGLAIGCTRATPSTITPVDGGSSGSRAPSAPSAARTTLGHGPTIKVLTYNVNYGLGGDPAGVEAIARADADIVLLQETTPEWAAALRSALAAKYAHMTFRDCCGAGGLAVLSRHPFVEKGYGHASGAWFPAWRLRFDTPLGDLQVLNVHLHPQLSERGSVVSGYFTTPAIRQSEVAQYYAQLDPSLPTLVAGDFNEDHDGAAVSYLAERGFRSALSEVSGCQPTWAWRTSFGTVRAELDHLVHDARLEPLEVRVLAAGRSDHLPVLGVFRAAT